MTTDHRNSRVLQGVGVAEFNGVVRIWQEVRKYTFLRKPLSSVIIIIIKLLLLLLFCAVKIWQKYAQSVVML